MKLINKEYLKLLFFRTLANFMIITSLIMLAKTLGPISLQEINYVFRQIKQVETKVVKTKPAKQEPAKPNAFANLLTKLNTKQEQIVPVNTDFSIVIPKIAANSKIITNVDSGDYEAYRAALAEGVAHAQGTALPGDNGHIYLFAHSADSFVNVGMYNAVFYLLYKLEPDDQVYIFYKGKKHLYKVVNKKVVSPNEVHYLTRSSSTEFLTLQTCWPPGTTMQRLMIFASPVVK